MIDVRTVVVSSVFWMACAASGQVGVFEDAPLFPQPQLVTGDGFRAVALGHLDDDGFVDAVTVQGTAGPGEFAVFLGVGDGTFLPGQRGPLGSCLFDVQLEDLDGNGILDMVITDLTDVPGLAMDNVAGVVFVLEGLGDGTFEVRSSIEVGTAAVSVRAGRFDGDQHVDLVVADRVESDVVQSSIRLLIGDGAFGFQEMGGPFLVGDLPLQIDVGDFNGDGRPDVAVPTADLTAVFLNDAAGGFQSAVDLPAAIEGMPQDVDPLTVLARDFDRDGNIDLAAAVTNTVQGYVSIRFGDGSANFTDQELAIADDNERNQVSVDAGDFNVDGFLDLAVCNRESGSISIFLQQLDQFGLSTRSFGDGIRVVTQGGPREVAVADINLDGLPDVVVARPDTDSLSVLIGKGDGSFAQADAAPVGSGPARVAVADLDGDGNLDAVTAETRMASNSVSILRGSGDGTFDGVVQSIAVSARPRAVAIADIVPGFGPLDIVVTNELSNAVTILRGESNGLFTQLPSISLSSGGGTRAWALEAADIDGDQRVDLVVTSSEGDRLNWLLGNANGSLRSAVGVATGDRPIAVSTFDLDGDGDFDAAVLCEDSGTVQIFEWDQSLVMPGYVICETIAGMFVAAEDVLLTRLDSDAHADVIVTDSATNEVIVYYGTAGACGTRFDAGQAVVLPVGSRPGGVRTGDLDRNGLPDIAVSNQFSDDISVILQSDDREFLGEQRFLGGDQPIDLELADMDNDAVLDVVVPNFQGDSVTVLINSTLASSAWTGGASGGGVLVFSDPANWSGGLPGLGDPNVAVFDGSLGEFGGGVEQIALTKDVRLRGIAHASESVRIDLREFDLDLVGDPGTLGSTNGLAIGVLPAFGGVPLAPAELRLASSEVFTRSLIASDVAIGVDLPGELELLGNGGPVQLRVGDGMFVVGQRATGSLKLSGDNPRLEYGIPSDGRGGGGALDGVFVIGDNAGGLVEARSGDAEVIAPLRALVLGRQEHGDGTLRIENDADWFHASSRMVIGEAGRGSVIIQSGGQLRTAISDPLNASGIFLATQEGSSGSVLITGGGSSWTDLAAVIEVGVVGEGSIRVEDGGDLKVATVRNRVNGRIAGDALIDADVVNFGLIEPGVRSGARGEQPGVLTISGNYNQLGDDAQSVNRAGRVVVRAFEDGGEIATDRLVVEGDATLEGSLIVDGSGLPGGLVAGSPVVLEAQSIDGRFSVAFMPPLDGGRFLSVDYAGLTSRGTGVVTLQVNSLNGDISDPASQDFLIDGTPTAAALGDLDGDGDEDLVVTVPGQLVVIMNRGVSGSSLWQGFDDGPQSVIALPIESDPRSVAIGDLDGDGAADDIAVADGLANHVALFASGASGPMEMGVIEFGANSEPEAVAFSDLDNDKWDDLIVALGGSNQVAALNSQGAGPVTAASARTLQTTQAGPTSLVALDTDLTPDGQADLIAVANRAAGTVQRFEIDGLGALQPAMANASSPVGAEPVQVIAADFDLDGVLDLATANRGDGTVSVLLGSAQGEFAPAAQLPVGTSPRSIAAIDLDPDEPGGGDLDLAVIVAGESGNSIQLLRNDLVVDEFDPDDRQLVFTPSSLVSDVGNPQFVLAGDVDSDNESDLVTVNDLDATRAGGRGIGGRVANISVLGAMQVVGACAGDADGNGLTQTADLTFVISNLGAGAPGASGTPGDVNGDGLTTTDDITFVVSNLGCGA
ncbi:MAG: FG-GAP-like repeat-containing protein [Planctomycetota bacterium]